jgi:hypothetical protein
MHKEDEELLTRVAKQAETEDGLVLDETRDPSPFHKVIKRLIETPPAPKQQGKRHARRKQAKQR